jgi:hypothetical protein
MHIKGSPSQPKPDEVPSKPFVNLDACLDGLKSSRTAADMETSNFFRQTQWELE